MKTLKHFLILVLILSATVLSAQEGDCNQNLSMFAESAKIKDYETAYKPWSTVHKECPKMSAAIYVYGERILKDRLDKAETPEEKAVASKELLQLYDDWIIAFPKKRGVLNVGDILSSKAQTMIDYKISSNSEIMAVFKEAFDKDFESFSNPKRLYNYFKITYGMYKEGSHGITQEQLFNKYEEMSEKFEIESAKLSKKLDVLLKKEESGELLTSKNLKEKKRYDINSKAIGVFLSNLDAIISKEATCENLIPLYQRNFEENKGDAIWLNRAASRMKNKGCSNDQLFVTIVEALHDLKPSATSAYFLGYVNDKKGNSTDALRYYEEAIKLEADPYKKAKILYKIALEFKERGRKSKARNYARQALKLQPSLGRAYLMIAGLYASSANDCGSSQFEKRAVYWLAAKTARKAGHVDASLNKTAVKTAQSYEGRAPSRTEIFTGGNEGKTIKFDCWINSSVIVPKL